MIHPFIFMRFVHSSEVHPSLTKSSVRIYKARMEEEGPQTSWRRVSWKIVKTLAQKTFGETIQISVEISCLLQTPDQDIPVMRGGCTEPLWDREYMNVIND